MHVIQRSHPSHSHDLQIRIFADFHNADQEGRIRLNCQGTLEDLTRHSIDLQENQWLTLYSEDLEVEGQVHYSPVEKLWVATIHWEQIRTVDDHVAQAQGSSVQNILT